MNFEVYLDDKLLYYPNDETFVIVNSKLELALNEAGSFEFDVPSYNLRYDDFNLRKSMVRVLQNSKEIFYGEVREIKDNFDFTRHIYCVGELAFLFDSIQPQAKYQGTPFDMLRSMISHHNAQVSERKRFDIGYVSVKDNYVYHFTNREDTLTAIREKLCKTLDGYLKIEKVGNKRTLSIVQLQNYGRYCQQEIQFGENLIDYSCNTSASDIATSVIPLGKRLEDSERTKYAVDGLDEYLTIRGTSTNTCHKNADDDYVKIDSAVDTFGNVRVVKTWDDVTIAENLQKKAIDWLKSAQYSTMTLELNAFDMNILDANIDSFDVGDTIHAWALPYGMDTTFPVQKKVIYINDLSKNTVSLGKTVQKSYTTQASNAVAKALEEIPAISPILKSAKDNALAQLLDETQGGHVVYEYAKDDNGVAKYIEAINICNNATIEASTKRWKWSANGIGYLTRATAQDPWKDLGVAMTADGQIVASFIKAGALTLSGNAKNNNPYLQVYEGNTQIGSWTTDGIKIEKGSIKLNSGIFEVTNAGGLTATDADIKGKISATSGSIGTNNTEAVRWQIGDHAIYNGCTGVNSTTAGTYVGTEGFRNQMADGAYTRIHGGAILTNQGVSASGFTVNDTDDGSIWSPYVTASKEVKAPKFKCGDSEGLTTAFTFVSGTYPSTKYKVVTVSGGIITKIEDV